MITNKPAATNSITGLSLYYYDSCPFCQFTLQALEKADVEVALRHIHRTPNYRSELIKQGGKAQVPCLKIDTVQGESTWLYESSDIIRFIGSVAERDQRSQSNAVAQ
ncbi:hypothetical protein A9Q99_11460 [Gammaproteobacteria bacterium 45_16_T64]|nr:hypothetical protein A9Q99_11460 [Gammaproteobacteria bacterium 45_16_T64]